MRAFDTSNGRPVAVDREFEYIVWRFRFLTGRSERLRPEMAWLLLALELGFIWHGPFGPAYLARPSLPGLLARPIWPGPLARPIWPGPLAQALGPFAKQLQRF